MIINTRVSEICKCISTKVTRGEEEEEEKKKRTEKKDEKKMDIKVRSR